MSLPTVALPIEQVTLSDGQVVEVRALTFEEWGHLGEVEGGIATMHLSIAYATDTNVGEVAAWCAATPFEDVQAVADAVRRVSKMDEHAAEASGGPSSSASETPSPSSSPSDSE